MDDGVLTALPLPASPTMARLWHVTLTVGGAPLDVPAVRASLDRLADERPFLLSARYAADRVELRYWEQAQSVEEAVPLALQLWREHERSAQLPAWQVLGLEVVDRETYRWRALHPKERSTLVPAGGIRPF